MIMIKLNHNKTVYTVEGEFAMIDVGETKTEEIALENTSQHKFVMNKIYLDGLQYSRIMNPPSVIDPKSTWILKVLTDVPMDANEPNRGKVAFDGYYIMV